MALRHLRQTRNDRLPTGLVLAAVLIGLGGYLAAATAEALEDNMDAMMTAVRSPHSPEWYDTVWPAVAAIRDSGEETDAVAPLSAALGDSDPVVRRHAAFFLAALAQTGWMDQPPDIAATLTAALADDDARVRELAARSVAHAFGDHEREALLIPASRDMDPRVRWTAIAGLSGWDRDRTEAATAPLIGAFDDPDPRTRYAAAFGLQEVLATDPAQTEPMVDPLVARLAGDDVANSHVAGYQMGLSGLSAEERHLPTLMALTSATDSAIRLRAAGQISQIVLLQQHKGAADPDLVAILLDVHRAGLTHEDAGIRASSAWSLMSIHKIDDTSLPHIDAALAVETHFETRHALRRVRATLAGEQPDYAGDQGWIYHGGLCLPHESFAIMGLRPWDDEFKVLDSLGEPARIRANWGEDDGGTHVILGYEYATLDIEIARTYAQRIATRSPTVSAGGLGVGITRQDALNLLGVAPNAEALAAQRFVVTDCDTQGETYLSLDFGADGRVAAMALVGHRP